MAKFTVFGTGNQAPYGIGEIISTHKSLRAARKAAAQWHNPCKILSRTHEYDAFGNVVGYVCDVNNLKAIKSYA